MLERYRLCRLSSDQDKFPFSQIGYQMTLQTDIEFEIIDKGQGRPAILFIHGYLCGPEDWLPQIEFLSNRYRTIAPALRGHGKTTRGRKMMSIDQLASDCISLLELLDIPELIIAGHSMGTRVTFEIARQISERTKGIILVEGSRLSHAQTKNQMISNFNKILSEQGHEKFIRNTFSSMVPNPEFNNLKSAKVSRALKISKHAAYELRCNAIIYDSDSIVAAMSETAVPVLVIQATDLTPERSFSPLKRDEIGAYPAFVKKHVGDLDIVQLEGFGHFIMLEAPDEVNAVIYRWLNQHDF